MTEKIHFFPDYIEYKAETGKITVSPLELNILGKDLKSFETNKNALKFWNGVLNPIGWEMPKITDSRMQLGEIHTIHPIEKYDVALIGVDMWFPSDEDKDPPTGNLFINRHSDVRVNPPPNWAVTGKECGIFKDGGRFRLMCGDLQKNAEKRFKEKFFK